MNNLVGERDCLLELFDQVRAQRPPVYDCDSWHNWLAAIGDCISALPSQRQRWAATVLVGNDICESMPGTPLAVAHLTILEAVARAAGVR